jgi:hypothetical protein
MSEIRFDINKVLPNPYQTRLAEDADHILKLAQSIVVLNKMLQIPAGRLTKDGLPELAFGHSRLAALKQIADTSPEELKEWGKEFANEKEKLDFYKRFSFISINIEEMTDEEMFKAAVAENADRKDLTPMEEANAMLIYKEKFGKTSDEIGQLFHLSGPSVRNKMRLIELPETVKLGLGVNYSEGVGREILIAYDLPETVKAIECFSHPGKQYPQNATLIEYIEETVKSGRTLLLEDLKEKIDNVMSRASVDMSSKPWKNDDVLVDTENNPLPTCKGCPLATKRDNKDVCLSRECYVNKTAAYELDYLQKASAKSEILILPEELEAYGLHTDFACSNIEALKKAQERGGCENLRLKFDQHNSYRGDDSATNTLKKDGFPNAKIVCMKRNGFCTCVKAYLNQVDLAEKGEGQMSEGELKEIRQSITQQKKINREMITNLANETANQLYKGLLDKNVKTLRWIFTNSPSYGFWHDTKEIESFNDLVNELFHHVMLSRMEGVALPKEALRHLNGYLIEAGLEPLDIEVGEPDLEPQSKTLMEVFTNQQGDDSAQDIAVLEATPAKDFAKETLDAVLLDEESVSSF